MNCSATLNCGELVCFVFVLCHSQNDSPALCREMEKGISGCSTLTKLSLRGLRLQHLPSTYFELLYLPPQYSSASVRAAMSLQSSLTEVEWKWCSFISKSNIGVTVKCCDCACVLCVMCAWVCGVRQWVGRERLCVCTLHAFVMMCMGACLCVHV